MPLRGLFYWFKIMATKLYRAGNGHFINGIECEARLFDCRNPLSFVGVDGWCKSPEDINKDSSGEWDDLTSDQIRELAKHSGIEGWEKKRINTLKEVLSGQNS